MGFPEQHARQLRCAPSRKMSAGSSACCGSQPEDRGEWSF